MRVLRDRLRPRGPVRVRTPRELLAGAGRLVLWFAVGLLLIRGLGATLGRADDPRTTHASHTAPARAWPDDAARALAVEFATAFLTHTLGEDPGLAARRLAALAAPDVAGQLAPQFDRGAPVQSVRSAT